MSRDFDPEEPPPEFEPEDEAGSSTELPVVVLGEDSEATSEAPRVRLLQGRIHEAWILYPVYILYWLAGATAAVFALGTDEWSAGPVALAWFLLYVWAWFYGVAYRYRRPLLKYTSVLVLLGFTAAVVFFTFERARPQRAMVEVHTLAERAGAPMLYWAGVATIIAAGLVLFHLLFLGRGYRKKRLTRDGAG